MIEAFKKGIFNARRFIQFMGPEVSRLLIAAVLAGFFLFLVESAFVVVIQGFLVAIGVSARDAFNLPHWYPTVLTPALLLLVVFGLARAFAYFAKSLLESLVTQTFYRIQRGRIIAHSLDFASEISTQEAVSIFSDTLNRAGAALSGVSSVLVTGTAGFFFFVLGLRLAPLEMLIGCLLLGAFGFFYKKFENRLKATGLGLDAQWEALNSTFLAGIKNNFFLRVHGLIDSERQKAFDGLAKYQKLIMTYQTASSLRMALPPFAGLAVVAFLSYLGLRQFGTPAAALISFFYIFMRSLQNVAEIASSLSNIRFLLPSLKRLYRWQLDLSNRAAQSKASVVDLSESEKTELKNSISAQGVVIGCNQVSFRYSSHSPFLFRDLTFKVERGECLVITGSSGTGKSSLLSLILGAADASQGMVLVNGVPIQAARSTLIEYVAYVGPETYLIPGSVRENLLYGHPCPSEVTSEKLWDALRIARADSFVESMAMKELTLLNEVAKISTGQRQRLAIARALIREPKLLVLDECTSNLDMQSESEIVDGLKRLNSHFTLIVVTHRPALKEIATSILDLSQYRAGETPQAL